MQGVGFKVELIFNRARSRMKKKYNMQVGRWFVSVSKSVPNPVLSCFVLSCPNAVQSCNSRGRIQNTNPGDGELQVKKK